MHLGYMPCSGIYLRHLYSKLVSKWDIFGVDEILHSAWAPGNETITFKSKTLLTRTEEIFNRANVQIWLSNIACLNPFESA